MIEINQKVINKIRSELVGIYILKINKLISDGKYSEAEKFLNLFLKAHPNNPDALKLKSKIPYAFSKDHTKTPESLKYYVQEFIKKHYPQELNIFDLAWRAFHDVTVADFKQNAVSGSLGFVGGQETSNLVLPKIIILLNTIGFERLNTLDSTEINKILHERGKELGCSEELINQLKNQIAETKKKF